LSAILSIQRPIDDKRGTQTLLVQFNVTEQLMSIKEVPCLMPGEQSGYLSGSKFMNVKNGNVPSPKVANGTRIDRLHFPEWLPEHEVQIDFEVT
jgi:hypothetical protein